MSQPRQLFQLQQIDTELDNSHARLREIAAALKDNAALKKAKKRLQQAESAHTTARKELKTAEENVADQERKIENNQRLTYSGSVTNPRELEDLQNEAAALKRFLAVLEERQLEKMIAFEDAQAALQAAQEKLGAVQAESAQQNSDLTNEQAELQTLVAKLEIQREGAIAIVSDENLATYDKLRVKGSGLAVSTVDGNICDACGSTLTAAQAQAAHSPSQITQCSNCQRILYAS